MFSVLFVFFLLVVLKNNKVYLIFVFENTKKYIFCVF